MLNQDPHISASVMFGRGRFQPGIIVEPKPEFRFDPTDEVKLAEFRNKIWCDLPEFVVLGHGVDFGAVQGQRC